MNKFDHTDVEFWKWGVIYYNPNDDSLIVPKLSGLGWTVNFAHRFVYLFLLIVIAAVYLIKYCIKNYF
ncbi:MAG: hypothetical protein EOP42_34165 [Sphingobacteriaceae bacterium]|nr:MAG: hypothetical protein EOP42_34165 [Sphingobacteriaceae bacterium]